MIKHSELFLPETEKRLNEIRATYDYYMKEIELIEEEHEMVKVTKPVRGSTEWNLRKNRLSVLHGKKRNFLTQARKIDSKRVIDLTQ